MSRIAAIRAAAAGKSAPAPDEDIEDETEDQPETPAAPLQKKDKDMTEQTDAQAIEAAKTEATKAANARFSAVLASDEYKGREALGQHLLAGDMSADDIISALKVAPKADAAALTEEQREAAEKGGRAEMQATLEGVKPSGTSADEGDKPTAEQAAAAGWKKATATANRLAGY